MGRNRERRAQTNSTEEQGWRDITSCMPPPPALLRHTELPFLRNYSSVVSAARARCLPCRSPMRPNKQVTQEEVSRLHIFFCTTASECEPCVNSALPRHPGGRTRGGKTTKLPRIHVPRFSAALGGRRDMCPPWEILDSAQGIGWMERQLHPEERGLNMTPRPGLEHSPQNTLLTHTRNTCRQGT